MSEKQCVGQLRLDWLQFTLNEQASSDDMSKSKMTRYQMEEYHERLLLVYIWLLVYISLSHSWYTAHNCWMESHRHLYEIFPSDPLDDLYERQHALEFRTSGSLCDSEGKGARGSPVAMLALL